MATADFVNGAIKGYNFVDNEFDENELEQQRRQAIQTEDQRYQQQQARQGRIDAETANDRAFSRKQAIESNEMARERLDMARQSQEFSQNRAEGQDAYAAQRAALQLEDRESGQNQQRRERLREQAVMYAQRSMAGGQPFPRELHDTLVNEGMPYLSFYDGIERPDQHRAALSLAPVLEAVGSGNLEAVNSPEALDAINALYADEISQGVGEVNQAKGGRVVSKRIAELAPSPVPGKFAAIIEVTLDNGETYLAPRTRQASTDPDDPVSLVDAGVALDDLMGRYQIARIQEQGRESIEQQYRSVYGALPGEKAADKPELQKATNNLTGETDFYTWDGDNLKSVQADAPSTGIPEGAIDLLMQDPSDEAKAEFDETFGQGSADRILQQSAPAVDQPGFEFDLTSWPGRNQ